MKQMIGLLVLAGCLAGCQQPASEPHGKLYVSNVLNGTVSVLDPIKGEVIKKIPVGGLPHNFAFSPDYRHLVVTNSATQNVSVIDTETDTVVKEVLTAPMPDVAAHRRIPNIGTYTSCNACHMDPRGAFPMGIGTTPSGKDMVVTNFKGGNVVRLSIGDWKVTQSRDLPYREQPSPTNVIFASGRDETYVLSRDLKKVPGRLTVLDGQLRPKRDLEVIKAPFGMVLSPDERELFVASRVTNKVEVYDTASWKLKRTIISGDGPVGLFVAHNNKLYTGNFYTNRPAYVSVIDAHTGKTIKRIPGEADITRMVTDPAQRYLYVANSGANKVQVIDLATDRVIRTMHAGAFPVDLAFKPAPASAPTP